MYAYAAAAVTAAVFGGGVGAVPQYNTTVVKLFVYIYIQTMHEYRPFDSPSLLFTLRTVYIPFLCRDRHATSEPVSALYINMKLHYIVNNQLISCWVWCPMANPVVNSPNTKNGCADA